MSARLRLSLQSTLLLVLARPAAARQAVLGDVVAFHAMESAKAYLAWGARMELHVKAPFIARVADVVAPRAQEQVRRVAARRVVAGVADIEPVCHKAVSIEVGEAIGPRTMGACTPKRMIAGDGRQPVSRWKSTPGPLPASAGGLLYSFPESGFELRHIHAQQGGVHPGAGHGSICTRREP